MSCPVVLWAASEQNQAVTAPVGRQSLLVVRERKCV